MRKYFIMMTVRVLCFVLMVVITPYGWYTWVLAVGAIFLPYFAVIVANVTVANGESRAVPPERELSATPTPRPVREPSVGVIQIQETRTVRPDAVDDDQNRPEAP